MLNDIKGDMLKQAPKGEVICMPVNTVGVAGKGLALWMKLHLPHTMDIYIRACRRSTISTGDLVVSCEEDWWIALIPTKYHWKNGSYPALIDLSVARLVRFMEDNFHPVVHMPRLGCGVDTGGLDYNTIVRPILAKYFEKSDLIANVYYL